MPANVAALLATPLAIASTMLPGVAVPSTTAFVSSTTPVVGTTAASTTPVVATTAASTTPVVTTPPVATASKATAARACVSDARVASARRYASARPGSVSFAVFVGGDIRSADGSVRYRSASLVKAMLLIAELRRHDRVHAPLTAADRSRLHAMIHVSDNDAASATFDLVGSSGLYAVAHLAGMKNYSNRASWGTSELTATDQARLWGRLNSLLPATYRSYARGLLGSISSAQVWGGAPVARGDGFHTMFKSGWLPRTNGWVVHQGLRIERGRCTIGIAVLTGGDATMATGVASIHGVVEHLLG